MLLLVAAPLLLGRPVRAAVPDYRLGDVATEDIITPVRLQVVNPDATEELRRKVAAQVPFVVLRTARSTADAEHDLRQSLDAARARFVAALEPMLHNRPVSAAGMDSQAVAGAVQQVRREVPEGLPVDRLAPLWISGASIEPVVSELLRPLRQVMAQPIVENKTDSPLPANQPVWLIAVSTPEERPPAEALDRGGTTLSAGKVISLWRARRLVETYYPAGQEAMGRYVASFVRVNAYPDAALSAVLRDRRMEGLAVNDVYEPAQVVVRKGQTIDRRALGALAVLRERTLIGTLQTRLDQEKSIAGQIAEQTIWIAGGLGLVCLALILILWRLRTRPGTALLPAGAIPGLPGSDPKALPDGSDGDEWRSRALLAEGKAERAQAAIRSGVLGWMREHVFRTLFRQRAELLSTHQRAEAEMHELELRLEQLHIPLQERIVAYEKRIADLERELAAKGEENRELLGARISAARQQLTVERERGRLAAN